MIYKKELVRSYVAKFIYSEKATKFCEIFTLLLSYVVPVKSKVKISKNLGPSQNMWTLQENSVRWQTKKTLWNLLTCTNSAGNNNDTSSTLFDSDTVRNSLCNASSVLTIFFVAEVIMKMIAFTPYGYWQSRRNRADLIVTMAGVGWIVVDYIFNNHYTLTFGTF